MRDFKSHRLTSLTILGILFCFAAVPITAKTSASLRLSLGKDTFELAEPTLLKAEITNNLDRDLILDNLTFFHLHTFPFRFSLFLITPDGQKSTYEAYRTVDICYSMDSPTYCSLYPGQSVSQYRVLWWTSIIPQEYYRALEKLPSGTYKLFATYELPSQKGLDKEILYSDTVEFVFLPLKQEYLSALREMDSLWESFLIARPSQEVRPGMQRLRYSNTPYSEAAYVQLLKWIYYDYDSLQTEKSRFDEQYPKSQFEIPLLSLMVSRATLTKHPSEVGPLFQLIAEKDSTHVGALMHRNEIGIITRKEAIERGIE